MANRIKGGRFLWTLAGVGAVSAASFYFNEPTGTRASDQTVTVGDIAMFGIEGQQGELIRYDVAAGQMRSLGPVQSPSGQVYLGIKALAYIPGHANLIGMWTDPADGKAKLVYIHTETARGMLIGQDMGEGEMTGATAVRSSTTGSYEVYALQTVPGDHVDFQIKDTRVVPDEAYAVKVEVLGAAISYGGQYDMPVTSRVHIDAASVDPFGSFTSALLGNVNLLNLFKLGGNPSYVHQAMIAADTPVTVSASSWVKSGKSILTDAGWKTYMTVNSLANSPQVKVLRNGDPVPRITGFLNQGNVADFVDDYVNSDTQKIELERNQAIFLFELGTTNFASDAADFQDLVVLVSLAKDPEDFEQGNAPKEVSRLVKVDHRTGAVEPVMTLRRVYKSLAGVTETTFHGVWQNKLYEIDTVAGTEKELGTTQYDHLATIEMLGQHLLGYASNAGRLVELSRGDGSTVGNAHAVGVNQMEAMTFLQISNLPRVSFD